MRHFEPDAMATVMCAMFSPSLDQVRISPAGHPPPIIAWPGQPAAPADAAPDLLIGVAGHRGRTSTGVSWSGRPTIVTMPAESTWPTRPARKTCWQRCSVMPRCSRRS